MSTERDDRPERTVPSGWARKTALDVAESRSIACSAICSRTDGRVERRRDLAADIGERRHLSARRWVSRYSRAFWIADADVGGDRAPAAGRRLAEAALAAGCSGR